MSYLNVDEVETVLGNLAAQYLNESRLIRLPESTCEGRVCHAVWFGQGQPGTKDVFMIIGGVHGLEWGSCEIALNFITDLLDPSASTNGLQYGQKLFSGPDIANLRSAVEFVVFPLVNPDGRKHSQGGSAWRKNRNDTYSKGFPNRIGVDINRNFDFLFDFDTTLVPQSGVSASDDTSEGTYHGPSPFSEPETRNVRSLLDQFPSTRWFVDLHSCSGNVLHVWGDDQMQTVDSTMRFDVPACNGKRGKRDDDYSEYIDPGDLKQVDLLAQAFTDNLHVVRGETYGIQSGFDYGLSCGASHDYAYSRGALGFAVEWGHVFQPDWTEMQCVIKDVTAGLIGMSIAASTPVHQQNENGVWADASSTEPA